MNIFLEPVYLNEAMMLNCAAYLFKGVVNEVQISKENSNQKNGEISAGFKFLQNVIGLSGKAATGNKVYKQEKLARKYTTGGLHMSVVDELRSKNELINFSGFEEKYEGKNYIGVEAILKPVDFYSIVEALKLSAPLIFKILHDFGDKFNPKIFNSSTKTEIIKYDEIFKDILEKLEKDYLKSSLLEMIMLDPSTGRQFGIVDIDVKEKDATEIKAKLTDGKFFIIGKTTKMIAQNQNIDLLSRSFLSTITSIINSFFLNIEKDEKLLIFKNNISISKNYIENICQLSVKGPAIRMMAMSVCI